MGAIVIDDHPLAIATAHNLLIKNDIKTSAELTEGGSTAQRVEASKPDIVIIDVDIPGVNGIRVLETLRRRQYSGIIIIVSAKDDHFYGKYCADAGASGFISKKKGMSNIIATIEAAKNDYYYFPFSLNRFVGSSTSDQQELDSLSKQEIGVMQYILDGKDNDDITEKVFISGKTVNTYKSRLMEKLECKSLMDLYAFAQCNKID